MPQQILNMAKKNFRKIIICVLWYCLFFVVLSSCNNTDTQKVENLAAFARIYGLVRWFYPSDEAQNIDWNQFALYGSSQVVGCRSVDDLKKKLETLFEPIAPGISFAGEGTPSNQSFITPPDTSGMHLVAWQHHGVDLGLMSNYYVSKRINRPLQTSNVSKVAIYSYFPAEDYKGHEIRLKARIKKTSLSDDFNIFLKLTDADDAYVTFCADTTLTPLVNTGEWEEYECRLRVRAVSNSSIYWGIYTEGEGSFCVDKMVLEDVTLGKTIIAPVLDGSFTERAAYPYVYEFSYSEKEMNIQTRNLIFKEHANFGNYKSQKLTDGLYVHVPLALYGTKKQTYPTGNHEALSILKKQMSNKAASVSNSIFMFADVIVAWNVIKYFSPYLAELPVNWDNELANTLSMISFREKSYNARPLKLMMAKLEDAHVFIKEIAENESPEKYLPLSVKKHNNQIIVVNTLDDSFEKGDIVLSVNGNDAFKDFESCEEIISGGDHHKAAKAAGHWLTYYRDTDKITVEVKRNNEKLTIKTNTLTPSDYYGKPYYTPSNQRKQSGWLNNNVLYLNVRTSNFGEVKNLLAERKPHQTVIIDARNFSRFLFRYMIPLLNPDAELKSNMRYITPKIAYPEAPVIEDTLPSLPRKTPNTKNIFLIGPNLISNYEDTLDNVRYNELGYFVGTNTGGCNGRVNLIYLPSGIEVSFTGMKVLSEMGAGYYYYRTGIAPDIYVEETIEDIRNGRDAVLEKAIEIAESDLELLGEKIHGA